jgi:hypothetical protein
MDGEGSLGARESSLASALIFFFFFLAFGFGLVKANFGCI